MVEGTINVKKAYETIAKILGEKNHVEITVSSVRLKNKDDEKKETA